MNSVIIGLALFLLVPIAIATIAVMVIRSGRRKDGSIDWWRLGRFHQ